MIRIMIADDHAIIREGLKQIISEAHDMVVCEEACNGKEVLEKAMSAKYDVLVLDVSMPDGNVIDIIKSLKAYKPHAKILVLSMHPENQYAIRVMKAGASGYLTKESATEEMVKAIRKVAQSRKYFSRSFAENLANKMLNGDPDKPPHEVLSNREYQVFLKLAEGLGVGEIADEMHLNSRTISTYRTRILQKLHLKTNADIIHYAIRHNLISGC